jgi:uncharacterized protein (DUF58 family)
MGEAPGGTADPAAGTTPVIRVLRLLEQLVRESLRRRFSLYLTVEGWVLVAAMMLIGLAALNTAAPLLYLMFSMLCSFFVLSALLANNTIRGLSLRRDCPCVWQAGDPMRVAIVLRNHKLFTSSFSLRLEDRLKGGILLGSSFCERIAPRGAEAVAPYLCTFHRRGDYAFESVTIATRFPFGLIERSISEPVAGRVLVLPQVIDVSRAMEPARGELGEYESHRRGQGSGLYGLREYTPDLPAKDIHWKVSARRGALMVREYESEERRRAVVVLDNRGGEANDDEAFERRVVLAASAVKWLLDRGHEVQLRTASGVVGFGAGPTHLTRCLKALAMLGRVAEAGPEVAGLLSTDPSATCFPIVDAPMAPSPGVFPVASADFAAELARTFRPLTVESARPTAP